MDEPKELSPIGDCVLVIDDDPTARELIANHLREEDLPSSQPAAVAKA